MRALRSALAGALLLGLVAAMGGCGSSFPLPPEVRLPLSPSQAYQVLGTWTGMTDVNDILLTQQGSQLFILFNHGPGAGTAPRGEVRAYRLSTPTVIDGIDFPGLFNPVALCAGGGSVFVLDQGDTCLARTNPRTQKCDTTGNYLLPRFEQWTNTISDLDHYWYVREYSLFGGPQASYFTDTLMAYVEGVAADAQGRVYVSGTAIILEPEPDDPRIRTRKFVSVVYRYLRGGPADPHVLPVGSWHRDKGWAVEQGTGFGNVVDPRGLHWGPSDGGALYCAVFGRNYAQRFSDVISNGGDAPAMAVAADTALEQPVDVYSDLQGFVYVVDQGNKRVLRFDANKEYVQRVDFEPDAFGRRVENPVAVAADDTLAYIADRGLGEVLRLKRRPR